MFAPLLREEMGRAFGNKCFPMALAIGCAVLALNVVFVVAPIAENLGSLPGSFPDSLFSRWSGAWGFDQFSQIFRYILPIIAVLPFGWSLKHDIETGYYAQLVTRTGQWPYLTAKAIAVSCSGAVAAVGPQALCFTVSAIVLPAVQPDVSAIGAFTITPLSMWADVYYSNAMAYTMLYLGLNLLGAGIIACTALPISLLASNNVVAVLAPFFLIAIMTTLLDGGSLASLTPLNFLRSEQITAADPALIGAYCVSSIALVTLVFAIIANRKDWR